MGLRPTGGVYGAQSSSAAVVDHNLNQRWEIALGRLRLKLDNIFSYTQGQWSGAVTFSLVRSLAGVL